MPTGQPDSHHPASSETTSADVVDRVIREAMEAGAFDDLPGEGEPIPGRGAVDDDLWWVRSWLERNRGSGQDSNKPE